MLEFKSFSIKNLLSVADFIKGNKFVCCDLSLGCLLMWHNGKDPKFAVWDDTLIVELNYGGDITFAYPIGKNADGAITEIERYTKSLDMPMKIYCATQKQAEDLKTRFDCGVCYSFGSEWSDYIYSASEIAKFKGRKFNGQRNHINKFNKSFPDAVFEEISDNDKVGIEKMLALYAREHDKMEGIEKKELRATKDLLAHYRDLGLDGYIIKVGGEVAGFTIGEVIGDTLVIHVEKALKKYEGIYPALFNAFVRHIVSRETEVNFVDREDDSGDVGLRISKRQYHPIRMLDKYYVRIHTPVAKVKNLPDISGTGVFLGEILESDKREYRMLSVDAENNKMWGYDYRDDGIIDAEIDDDTFYKDQLEDRVYGESLNFAVRENAGGKLIGEVIIYNFTATDKGEIGCRIAKEFHGRGIGSKAFALAAKWAKTELGITLVAKRYKENVASEKMIKGAGFRFIKEEGRFHYYEL
ncbi:MAG: GNAT family N-acetyltransferase [Clostridia bacterium]|nr:GNAT family N-acetyltransferase [Clostridia bacterium]